MKKLLHFFSQLIPVALGVYLAIWAGNWNENRKQTENLKSFKEQLLQEIKNNSAKIKAVQDYHKMVKDTTSFYLDNPEKFKSGKFWRGYSAPSLSTNTLEIGKQTNLLNQFNLSELDKTYEMYTLFEDYNKLNDRALNQLDFSKVYGNDSDRMGLLMVIHANMVDYYYQEIEIIESTTKFIENFK